MPLWSFSLKTTLFLPKDPHLIGARHALETMRPNCADFLLVIKLFLSNLATFLPQVSNIAEQSTNTCQDDPIFQPIDVAVVRHCTLTHATSTGQHSFVPPLMSLSCELASRSTLVGWVGSWLGLGRTNCCSCFSILILHSQFMLTSIVNRTVCISISSFVQPL